MCVCDMMCEYIYIYIYEVVLEVWWVTCWTVTLLLTSSSNSHGYVHFPSRSIGKVWTPFLPGLWIKHPQTKNPKPIYIYMLHSRKARLANLHEWVRVSLGAPFILPCVTSKQRGLSINIQLYTYTCGNKINNNDERTHFFRKIYLSHFIRNGCKRVVRGELETEQTATYWPPVPLSLAALLSRSAGLLNRGSWGPIALCWVLVLSTASYLQLWLQLTQPVCGTGLHNCLTSTCFLWASLLHPIQPVHSQSYTLISSTGCTCYLHRCISYLTAWPRVNTLHTHTHTHIYIYIYI